MSCVTLASCATSVPDMRQVNAKTAFVNVINEPFALMEAIGHSTVRLVAVLPADLMNVQPVAVDLILVCRCRAVPGREPHADS